MHTAKVVIHEVNDVGWDANPTACAENNGGITIPPYTIMRLS